MHFSSLFQLVTGLVALSSAAMGWYSIPSSTESSAHCFVAHPVGEEHVHPNDLGRRELEATSRHVATGKCAREIARYNSARRLKRRMLAARSLNPRDEPGSNPNVLIPGKNYQIPEEDKPTYKTIQNNTCVLAPEITEGPYFVRNELLRGDIREDQPGVDLELDIGVMDIRTCKPIPKALVQIWSCNATGFYSSFTTAPALDPIVLPASTDPVFTNSASISRLIELSGENLAVNKTDEVSTIRSINIATLIIGVDDLAARCLPDKR
ncbi:hypothetical protein FRC12_007876 [Ceratobasidium sp. 428]|nr:hypothetical protein FRC12_007876 [Ceratobasidium sp. 428]